jgi:hypothetical protein
MLRKTTEDVCSHRDMFKFSKVGVSSSFFPLDTMRRHPYAKRLRLEHPCPHYPPLARRVFVFCIELRNEFSV